MTSTEDDYEVKRTIWDSKIPIEFLLDNSHPGRTQQSYFAILPRISYFPLYLDEFIRILIGNNISEEELANIWLLHNGEMLKWHYPIGVLYDMFFSTSAGEADRILPWVITIKIKNFPDELIRCHSKDVMKFNFLQTIKEASQIKHKHNIASTMTKDEHEHLFKSLCNDRFNDFWSINKKMDFQSNKEIEAGCSNVPIRFYQHSHPIRQLPIPLRHKDGTDEFVETTLYHAIIKAFPGYMDNVFTAISHGIELPLDTSIGWIATNLSYPDNFIHIVLKFQKN